jgi:glycosyltransferase involved in cell wall biosynthesis
MITGGSRRITQWWNCRKLRSGCDVWIEDPVSLAAPGRRNIGKRVVLVHHLSRINLQDHTFGRLVDRLFFRELETVDHLVVVSRFWRDWFRKRTSVPISIIYNGFRVDDYDVSEIDAGTLRRSLGLDHRPIVYLGSRRKEKGVREVARILKAGDEWQLVTSGLNAFHIEAKHLDCSFPEYLRLLKISAVTVQMPVYAEGWNRLVHESLLAGTPVVANGSGGMGELLEGAGQPVCPSLGEVREMVLEIVRSGRRVSDESRGYLQEFTMDRFKAEWNNLIERLV